jgi:hypothetical protein
MIYLWLKGKSASTQITSSLHGYGGGPPPCWRFHAPDAHSPVASGLGTPARSHGSGAEAMPAVKGPEYFRAPVYNI